MAQFLFLCLLFLNAFLSLAMATDKPHFMAKSISEPPSNPPAESPAEPPAIRKLGKHQEKQVSSSVFPCFSPSEAPQSEEKKLHSTSEEEGILSHQRASVEGESEEALGSHGHHRRRSVDKSIVGGGVILGGLTTTFLVAVFCYIRATGRHNAEITV